jgi:hypothetical protein
VLNPAQSDRDGSTCKSTILTKYAAARGSRDPNGARARGSSRGALGLVQVFTGRSSLKCWGPTTDRDDSFGKIDHSDEYAARGSRDLMVRVLVESPGRIGLVQPAFMAGRQSAFIGRSTIGSASPTVDRDGSLVKSSVLTKHAARVTASPRAR